MMGQGVGKRNSKRGFAQTMYFQHGDEAIVDELMRRIKSGLILDADNRQYQSFSAFMRDAMHEKLSREVEDGDAG